MSQNGLLTPAGAKTPAGAITVLNQDSGGNLKVATTPAAGAVQITQAKGAKYVTFGAAGNISLGGNASIGDTISSVLIVPTALTAGNVSITDGNVTIPLLVTGNLTNLDPINLTGLNLTSVNAGWRLISGATVGGVAIGQFTP